MSMSIDPNNIAVSLQSILAAQRAAYAKSPAPTYQQRCQQLTALKQALIDHQHQLVSALNQDYGQRPEQDSLVGDIMPCVININYTLKRLKKWMKPQRRSAGLLLAPATVRVEYQPLGVIGIMVPWNFPIMLSMGPLVSALAAGNRAMIKFSEFTPNTNAALIKMLSDVFENDQVASIVGEVDVAAKFSALAFDHLIFTGSTTVGRHVMRAAADNLTPVTLELGGKSPVIIAPDMPMATAVERLIYGKCLNAGQICVAPDYILCPKDQVNQFIAQYQRQFQKMYGTSNNRPDYANIINEAQQHRLISWLEDAKQKGAQVVSANGQDYDPQSANLATQLLTEVNDDMLVMQQEIFGPILPIIGYDNLDQALTYVNDRPRPLALYIMSFDKPTQTKILQQTHSGGVCINDSVFHVAADDAPFGGVGASGMGHYHGKEGFLTFSNARTVLARGSILNTGKLVHPPYGGLIGKMLIKIFLR
ncbi:MAG: coniferyl aldehyde dehydrogenase [Gammaproteobacteria bacterium]|nr:coniferyl aldehyde dehydrogenase [Gammaproteobacteria bacterium]